jgi:hypothetical protein
MINIKTLSLIDNYLRAILPADLYLSFGGINVLLCGDFFQLLLVGGQLLYFLLHTNANTLKGHNHYRALDRTIRLVQVMRQQGEDKLSTRFWPALGELQESKLSRRAGSSYVHVWPTSSPELRLQYFIRPYGYILQLRGSGRRTSRGYRPQTSP